MSNNILFLPFIAIYVALKARHFSEQEIDGFRDCFYLNCKSGVINDVDQLKFVMRSLGFSPTIDELKRYLEQRGE